MKTPNSKLETRNPKPETASLEPLDSGMTTESRMRQPGKLVLEDGSSFPGESFGSHGSIAGEVVFTTGMVGYPESLTDPSYKGQILVCTYPLIGNYGVAAREKFGVRSSQFAVRSSEFESDRIQISGLIVADYSEEFNHWAAASSLADWLSENNVPALTGIDTRALTKRLREKGVMLGKIVVDRDVPLFDPNAMNLVSQVSCAAPVECGAGMASMQETEQAGAAGRHGGETSHVAVVEHGEGATNRRREAAPTMENRRREAAPTEACHGRAGRHSPHVVVLDCGVKASIISSLLARGADVTRVPWDFPPADLKFSGLLISNGPGDPKMCGRTIENIRKVMKLGVPILGICLGNQLLALAAGADTYKLRYGHRGQNQPCVNMETGRCYITSQNHGYAVHERTIPPNWEPLYRNANDNTNEGIKHRTRPFVGVQFHPEASPGPTDTGFVFDDFLRLCSGL